MSTAGPAPRPQPPRKAPDAQRIEIGGQRAFGERRAPRFEGR